jgi:hypothetical protein
MIVSKISHNHVSRAEQHTSGIEASVLPSPYPLQTVSYNRQSFALLRDYYMALHAYYMKLSTVRAMRPTRLIPFLR